MSKYKNETMSIIDNDIMNLFPLSYVKNYLRIDNEYDDDFLNNAIATACNYAERITGKILGLKTIQLSFETTSPISSISKQEIKIKKIISVSVNNNKIDNSCYYIRNGECIFKKQIKGKVVIVFETGIPYNEINLDIRQAILFHIASMFNNKDGGCQVPSASTEIYNTYRFIKL